MHGKVVILPKGQSENLEGGELRYLRYRRARDARRVRIGMIPVSVYSGVMTKFELLERPSI